MHPTLSEKLCNLRCDSSNFDINSSTYYAWTAMLTDIVIGVSQGVRQFLGRQARAESVLDFLAYDFKRAVQIDCLTVCCMLACKRCHIAVNWLNSRNKAIQP